MDIFKEEISSIKIKIKKDEILFDTDEFPRHGTTLEKISALKPVLKKMELSRLEMHLV